MNSLDIYNILNYCGNIETIKNILDQNYDIDKPITRSGNSVLLVAISCHRLNAIKLLLEYGSDINFVNEAGNNGLMTGILFGAPYSIMEFLVKNGCNINRQNKEGKTPLIYATTCGRFRYIKNLLRLGCLTKLKDNNGNDFIDYMRANQLKKFILEITKCVNLRPLLVQCIDYVNSNLSKFDKNIINGLIRDVKKLINL